MTLLRVRFPASPNSDKEARDKMQASLLGSLCKRMKDVLINPSGASQLYSYINQSGLPDKAKSALVAVVDDNISTAQPDTAEATHVKPQSLTHITHYMTEKDWSTWDDVRSTPHDWISVGASRLKACNVKSLKEDTVKWFQALLAANFKKRHGNLPRYRQIYQWAQDLRSTFHATASWTSPGVPMPLVYPDNPADLGAAFMSAAYAADDPPICRVVPDLANIARNHVPTRSTSNLLKAELEAEAKQPVLQKAKEATLTKDDLLEALKTAGNIWAAARPDAPPSVTHQAEGNLQATDRAVLQNTLATKSDGRMPSAPFLAKNLPGMAAAAELSSKAICDKGAAAQQHPAVPEQPASDSAAEQPNPRRRINGKRAPEAAGLTALSAEDYETMAFKRLKDAKSAAAAASAAKKAIKAAELPGSKADKATPAGSRAAPAAPALKAGIGGCGKCRGAPNGCHQCQKPTFTGMRFADRAAWRRWYQTHNA